MAVNHCYIYNKGKRHDIGNSFRNIWVVRYDYKGRQICQTFKESSEDEIRDIINARTEGQYSNLDCWEVSSFIQQLKKKDSEPLIVGRGHSPYMVYICYNIETDSVRTCTIPDVDDLILGGFY